jgi:hypothetical protein
MVSAQEVASLVTVANVLRDLGWKVRGRRRADCGLCRGRSAGTVSFRERVWTCHRCHAGGDVFDLVRQAHRCGFRSALVHLARLGGVRLSGYSAAEASRASVARERQRRQIAAEAEELLADERALLRELRDHIHRCDRVLHRPGPWDERQWLRARVAGDWLDRFLLPAFSVLTFADPDLRARFVRRPEQRHEIVAAVRQAGGVLTERGTFVEILR